MANLKSSVRVEEQGERGARPRHEGRAARRFAWLLPVLILAPLELGAKGCDSAVVGDDCPPGATAAKCVGSGGTAATGGSTATGGATVTGGKTGTGGSGGATGVCGGLLGAQCGKGEFCDFPVTAQCGASDQTGVCRAIPQVCTTEYHAVCGCDGKTYGNACNAAAAGVALASESACVTVGEACGGLIGAGCASGEFCNYAADAACGAADQTGTCTLIPQVCTDEYAPVCGCDGNTYATACVAAAASVSVVHTGECAATACGGLRGLSCPDGQYCNYALDAQCGAADQTGVCAPVPTGPCLPNYDPVCGCDGKTYGTACEAATARVSVAALGACATTGTACGARLGNTCAKGEYCEFSLQAACGFADGTGLCTAIPSACTKELKPVCGCDGTTYSNPCMAALAGVSVGPDSTCKPATGASCGGFSGQMCQKGEYCHYPDDAQCGAADQTGVCTQIPSGACDTIYQPVCGCDGKTYSNACVAGLAGTSISSKGACQ